MFAPDATADLAGDLRALAANQRRQVLASLSPAEQSRISALLDPGTPSPHAPAPRPAPAPLPAQAPPPAFGRYSPWLARQLQELQSGSTGLEAGWTMTPAARRLLLQLAAEETNDEASPADAPARAETTRSLIGAIGSLFVARKARA